MCHVLLCMTHMAGNRTGREALDRSGISALVDALTTLGIPISAGSPHHDEDLVITLPGGAALNIEVMTAAVPTSGQLRRALENAGDGHVVVVADQLSGPLRSEIEAAGAGWLDRRGHLKLVAPGLWIDAEIPPSPRREGGPAGFDAIRGRAGLAAATALLLEPEAPPGPSAIARRAGLDQSTISRALASLADGHLVERVGRGRYRPLVPELFWALADAWPRDKVVVRWKDRLGESDPLGLWSAGQEIGCALAGVRGAVGWGAPLAATGDYPLHVYAPSTELVRRVRIVNEGGDGAEVHFSVDPAGYVTSHRYEGIDQHWWTAHPLFCALDLTQAARDREALEEWDPPDGFTRVW